MLKKDFFDKLADGLTLQISSLKNHFIVCGYGALGKTVCAELNANKKSFVVIDSNEKLVEHLLSQGFLVVHGDALDQQVLKNAGIQTASRVISALLSDAANVFLALTAKDLNPRIHVATRAFGEDAVGKLHKAGADLVVVPDVVAGLELSREALGLKDSKMHKLVSKR